MNGVPVRGFFLDPSTPDADRIYYSIAVDVQTRCWNWLGHIGDTGYGRVYQPATRRTGHAHRVAYETFVGPIPAGMQLDHLCRNRACCNPAHLEPVTAFINVRRGQSPAMQARRRTHCAKGHPFALHGVVRHGRRICRTCQNDYCRAYYHRQRAAALKASA